jgi:hypothetical protein
MLKIAGSIALHVGMNNRAMFIGWAFCHVSDRQIGFLRGVLGTHCIESRSRAVV